MTTDDARTAPDTPAAADPDAPAPDGTAHPDPAKARIAESYRARREDVLAVARAIHADPEIAFCLLYTSDAADE